MDRDSIKMNFPHPFIFFSSFTLITNNHQHDRSVYPPISPHLVQRMSTHDMRYLFVACELRVFRTWEYQVKKWQKEATKAKSENCETIFYVMCGVRMSIKWKCFVSHLVSEHNNSSKTWVTSWLLFWWSIYYISRIIKTASWYGITSTKARFEMKKNYPEIRWMEMEKIIFYLF